VRDGEQRRKALGAGFLLSAESLLEAGSGFLPEQ
jgi:hypothetical protein